MTALTSAVDHEHVQPNNKSTTPHSSINGVSPSNADVPSTKGRAKMSPSGDKLHQRSDSEPRQEQSAKVAAVQFNLGPRNGTENGTTLQEQHEAGAEVEPQQQSLDGPAVVKSPTSTEARSLEDGKHDANGVLGTPRRQRSINFIRSATTEAVPAQSKTQSTEMADVVGAATDGHVSRIMSKLKFLAASPVSHQFSTRNNAPEHNDGEGQHSTTLSPASAGAGDGYFDDDEGSGLDADAEESPTESPSRPEYRKRKRSRMRPAGELSPGATGSGVQTAPSTPRMSKLPLWMRQSADSPIVAPGSPPTASLFRRATMTDIPEIHRQGVSEDEGRDRLSRDPLWRRGSAWVHGSRAPHASANPNPNDRLEALEQSGNRRPGNFRRITRTGLTRGHTSDASPSAWRQRSERTTSLSAQKWRQIKAGLKMIGQRRKEENKIDHAKSAELLAELLAGAPAAVFLASMFQRDEHGHKRIPVLLEQLKVRVMDIKNVDGDRHVIFRIELEYGSGMTRMKWVIHRSLRDFANLHLKYKLQGQTEKYIQMRPGDSSKTKLPRFPKSAFPYLRNARGLMDDGDDEDENDNSGHETDTNAQGRPPRLRKSRSSFGFHRRKSSFGLPPPGALSDAGRMGSFGGANPSLMKTAYHDRQRAKLESYLNQMIIWLMFRADGNRLCKFLELSALGVRLAAEGGYHGKEGVMMINANRGLEMRNRLNDPRSVLKGNESKWFLVRHSYIVCVDSPSDMNVFDVFLVDADFTVESKTKRLRDENPHNLAKRATNSAAHPQHEPLRLRNSERRLKLLAKNERQLYQFEESIKFMAQNTEWSRRHRFESFAPVRKGVYAQWLVDGRDYMWNVSRAISMARDVIYIHDWWLSPELYMRRPAAISQKWRLDRLLQRKAQEGVKIFVILYRNINSAIPIDSEYSKFSLLDLHPNVFVQRSPNQIRQNTFFWAHHEKICIVDHTVAFCGGVDLCFGRWDTPQHSLVDDKLTGFELNHDKPKDADHCQLWPGKDYSNPRVQDFFDLAQPYEEMYDRSKVPRMPWHDVGMQIVGQPARDLTRHFVQRWNFVLRQRKPTRPTPFLLPPPDFNPADLEALGLDGTCEIQVLRSASEWSLGTPGKTECSIQNAYIKMIETSEHFVYVENQFFVSSCQIEGTKIENHIGDALVERIIRAHREETEWRAVIVIPLMPGFESSVDVQEGSSVRLIMTCQYRSICRGETSMFERLRAQGIEPEDYIQFYGLRQWGKIGPKKALTTEQLYIHAKCMIVDDRIAIIGSANINERSMLGQRDSEIAAVIRDSRMVPSVMAGEPYKVGHFPHTLRMRLMREHLGLDVDEISEDEPLESEADGSAGSCHSGENSVGPDFTEAEDDLEMRLIASKHRAEDELLAKQAELHSFNHDEDWEQANNRHLESNKKPTHDRRIQQNIDHARDVRGEGADHMLANGPGHASGLDTRIDSQGREVLISASGINGGHHGSVSKSGSGPRSRARSSATDATRYSNNVGNARLPPPRLFRMDTELLGLTQLSQLPPLPDTDDTDIGGPPLQQILSSSTSLAISDVVADMKHPIVSRDCMRDPVTDAFFVDTLQVLATNNTKLYRRVFRCMPDSEVRTWKEYREYDAFAERFAQSQGAPRVRPKQEQDKTTKSGPPGAGTAGEQTKSDTEKTERSKNKAKKKFGMKRGKKDDKNEEDTSQDRVWENAESRGDVQSSSPTVSRSGTAHTNHDAEKAAAQVEDSLGPLPVPSSTPSPMPGQTGSRASGSQRRRRRGTTRTSHRPFLASEETMLSQDESEALCHLIRGHLVLWPYDWLDKEEKGGGWMYPVDSVAPLEIYS